MTDPNEKAIMDQELDEETLSKKDEEHDETMERFYDDLQQTIW